MTPAELIEELVRRGESLAVAESLTGGLLAATLVDVPGASRVFRGGLVVYATDLKASLAGVPVDLLDRRGPVDPDVALALAQGARQRCLADWGLATTGVAGPDPQNGIAVGTVFVAIAGPAAPTAPADALTPAGAPMENALVRKLVLSGDRSAIRHATVAAGLDLLAEALAGPPAS